MRWIDAAASSMARALSSELARLGRRAVRHEVRGVAHSGVQLQQFARFLREAVRRADQPVRGPRHVGHHAADQGAQAVGHFRHDPVHRADFVQRAHGMIPQQPVRRLEISGGDGLRAGHHAPERPYRPGDRPDDEAGAEQRIGDHEHEIRNAVPDDAVGDFLHQRRVGIDSEHGDEASVRAQDRRVGRRVKPVQRIFHNIGARREAVPQPLQMLRVDIRFLVDRGRHVRIPRLSVDHDVCPASSSARKI